MGINALFDPKRKRKIQEALRRRDASVFRRGRQAMENDRAGEPDAGGAASSSVSVEEPTRIFRPAQSRSEVQDSPSNDEPDPATAKLLEACEKGDFEGAEDALRMGANADFMRFIRHSGSPDLEEEVIGKVIRPIWLAKENGHTEIVELLKRLGVKE